MKTILDLLSGTEFLTGCVAGLIGLAITASSLGRRIDWGIVWVLGGLGAVARLGMDAVTRATRELEAGWWMVAAAIVASSIAAFGMTRARRHPHLVLALGASVMGIWATVPDTEVTSVTLGVTVAMLSSLWPMRRAVIGTVGSALVALTMSATVLLGGGGRDRATLGALGVVATLGYFGSLPRSWAVRNEFLDLAVHLLLVVTWVGVARINTSPPVAVAIGLAVTSLTIGLFRIGSEGSLGRGEQLGDGGDDAVPVLGSE